MGLFESLKFPFNKGKLKKEEFEQLRHLINDIVKDGIVSESEIVKIRSFYNKMLLTHDEFYSVVEEIFRGCVYQAIQDRRVSEYEKSVLRHFAEKLSISEKTQDWMEKEIAIYSLLNEYEVSNELPVIDVPVILQKNEVGHLYIPANLIEERVVGREYRGASKGVSVRVVKGVSFRVGQSKGRLHSEKAQISVSEGAFVITNKRVIFSGDRKSIAHNLTKLIDMRLYDDAFQYTITNRQSPIVIGLMGSAYAELCGIVLSKALDNL